MDQIFPAHAFLTPHNDSVHERRRDTGQIGNAPCHNQPTGDAFGQVAVLEIRQILGAPSICDFHHGMCQATKALVASQHGVYVGFVGNVIAV